MRRALLTAALLFACSETTESLPPTGRDATPTADRSVDAAAADASQIDSGHPDARPGDAQPSDAAALDVTSFDAFTPDATGVDAAIMDADPPDLGFLDAGPPSCSNDADCAPAGWCRETQAGGRACTPWATEGDFCGGFVIPWSRQRCEPRLTCMDRNPLLADAPGTCLIPATVADLTTNPRTYAGHVVGVRTGYVQTGIPSCTRIACSQMNPCCNTCNSTQVLADTSSASAIVRLVSPMGVNYACAGNECDYQDNCDLPIGRYRVFGTFRNASPPTIDVTTIVMLP